jgi:hypothetical protein
MLVELETTVVRERQVVFATFGFTFESLYWYCYPEQPYLQIDTYNFSRAMHWILVL